ncbi:branched-chain amino acid ABC transporter permease [Paenactinomyces guangxiensis]|uniref:Branched-chain amino acid ABC transporter permease n=1 Tax=Paenactinomyces guangxiensis TaxID=1490290 RepID=A0A7W1WSL4_9BACL|nr:branched-chain amino acid ABC transporter permease [Paenactinomyces guangxiensis]MBA4495223.1 branched-chain amino acid ABC transporter permease [Paenactinomyces guangxiensis]MBH8592307.1 branched-chain amino acid ABC transporter permease [Paenactinomyces guangxiensis]
MIKSRRDQIKAGLLLITGLFLVLFPWINDSRSSLILMTQIFIFAVFAMSYDLLLGYTGIISFGHAMFFGIGAYSTGIWLVRTDATLEALVFAMLTTLILCMVLSYVVGILSLRLKSHYYAMLTLAFAGLFQVGAEKWRSLTKGNDGFTFRIPEELMNRESFYLISLLFMVIIFLLLRRFTQSPMGKVLQSIRENERRAKSLGYQVMHYKVAASMIAGVIAGLSGMMYALSLRFVNTAVFAVDVTLDVLLMTIIGGVGTLYGAVIGAGIIELAHDVLADLADVHWLFERWIILFGLIYILAVIFFPKGIVGSVNRRLGNEKWQRKGKQSPAAELRK